jgi:hypothetical protein
MDAMVRLPLDQGSKFTADTIYRLSSNAHPTDAWRGLGLDGGHKAGHQF